MVTINSCEWIGVDVTPVFLEGRLQSFSVTLSGGESKSVPNCPDNSDYERIRIWNTENGNPLGLE